jgi:colanic acid biosynthesis glycosyl transferase WcaI
MIDKSTKINPEFLLLCQLFYPELVSTGQTLTELCEKLVESGVNIEVVCAPPTVVDRNTKVAKQTYHKGIRIRRVWGTRLPKLNLIGRVTNQLTFAGSALLYLLFNPPRKPILVLTNPPFLALICAILRKLRLCGPYIYLIFDVYPETAIRLGVLKENSLLSRLWERVNRISLENASSIVVIGRCMQDVIKNKLTRYGLQPDGKLTHIPVWSDDRLIRAAVGKPNPFKKRWQLQNKFTVGYFGNMGRFHDMETIMEAARILNPYKDIIFLFVGEGHKKKWTVNFAEKNELDNCRFYTYVDRKDLGYALSVADIGLVSLLDGQEGLSVPSKTFGMLAAGVPVIAIMSSTSEIAKVVEEEHCGIVIRPGREKDLANCILEVYNDRERLKTMGQNALKAIDTKYNLKAASRQYLDLITKVDSVKS